MKEKGFKDDSSTKGWSWPADPVLRQDPSWAWIFEQRGSTPFGTLLSFCFVFLPTKTWSLFFWGSSQCSPTSKRNGERTTTQHLSRGVLLGPPLAALRCPRASQKSKVHTATKFFLFLAKSTEEKHPKREPRKRVRSQITKKHAIRKNNCKRFALFFSKKRRRENEELKTKQRSHLQAEGFHETGGTSGRFAFTLGDGFFKVFSFGGCREKNPKKRVTFAKKQAKIAIRDGLGSLFSGLEWQKLLWSGFFKKTFARARQSLRLEHPFGTASEVLSSGWWLRGFQKPPVRGSW